MKNLPAVQEIWFQSLDWEDPLEKGKATTPVFWPGEFHGLYSSWGLRESNTTERLSLSHHIFIQSCADGHLGYQHILAVISNAALDVTVQVFL